MEAVNGALIQETVLEQREFFSTGETKSLSFRIEHLKRLKSIIRKYEKEILEALWKDLHKSAEEAYLTEISLVTQEIDYHIRHLKKWIKPQSVPTPLHLIPSKSFIYTEPLGTVLIAAPWNYPFQLLINPLVGAISAGCCSVLKPSPYTPCTAGLMEKMITEAFNPRYITLFQGGREVNRHLFQTHFDLIFYTGSPYVGRVVMEAASKNLTPVILELGGKSPCIVDKDADLEMAARRIAWGKTINAGQTCIAPDYLFAHVSIKDRLLDEIALSFKKMHGEDIKKSLYYPRIVNNRAMERLADLMNHGRIHSGGEIDRKERYIAPTIIDGVKAEYPVMQEEIFGPILPVMTFKDTEEVISHIKADEKPLAFYYFGPEKKAEALLKQIPSGGGCLNDTLMHIANHHLPFGGVGNSGMGKYHGKNSFHAFSNRRSIVKTPTWLDMPFRYAPFKYFGLIKRIL